MVMRTVCGDGRWLGRVLAGVSLVVITAGTAAANDPAFVRPDGRKVALIRSTTEYGVVFGNTQSADACAKRVAAAGQGAMKSLEDAPDARVRILTVSKVSADRRELLHRDTAIREVRPVYRFAGADTPVISSGTIVVRLRHDLSDARRQQLWDDYTTEFGRPVSGMPNVYLLGPFAEDYDEVTLAERLADDARTVWAQPNFRTPLVTQQIAAPDGLVDKQWHLNNTGEFGGTPGADIDAPEAWVLAEGQDVLVGMFDDACDVDHEDLRGNYIGEGHDASLPSNADGFDDPRPKQIGDRHGTAVMGLAVARANSVGVRGVAYLARFTASRGLGELLTYEEIASVYTFARQQRVDVHINSWGLPWGVPSPAVITDAINLAFTDGRNKGDLDGDDNDDPLGMVILFASGNDGVEIEAGFELATLRSVIGVGASNDADFRASYSNYGPEIGVLAPSDDDFHAGMVTTDNTDLPAGIENGFNVGGFSADTGLAEIDAEGNYTDSFSGTSAACPVAAGVAALVLSKNQVLTATDVRLILEHTADPVSPGDAHYHGITSRSLKYGYGRLNAGGGGDKLGAVEATVQSLTNGNRTWPDRPANVVVQTPFIRWQQNFGTDEFLVLQSDTEFGFIPEDGLCYDSQQLGCGSATIEPLPEGVEVLTVGCELTCAADETPACEEGADQCALFLIPAGKKYFGIYGRSSIGRYSFGVAADSDGNVLDSGIIGEGEGGGTDPGTTQPSGPAVTISATPLEGFSPLEVNFKGNAVSELPIDESQTAWDFDVDDSILVNTNKRTTSHTYTVATGQSKTFVARLTMFDVADNSGFAEVAIRVHGEQIDGGEDPTGTGDIRIVVGIPGNPGSDVDTGTSPFEVLLSIDSSGLAGTLLSVAWDLGDGERATGLVVPHTYVNEGETALRIPITATVTTQTSGGTTISTPASRIITVESGEAPIDVGDPHLPGTGTQGGGESTTPCSGVGIIPLLFGLVSLMWMRRRT